MLGHSVGEYAAACAAGVFSAEDGIRFVAERARLMQALPAGGVMAAVFASEERVRIALSAVGDAVSIAALNGPANTVIAGPERLVEQVTSALAADGIKSQRLVTSHAFHSPLLEPMLSELERAAAAVQFAEPRIDLISNLSGRPVLNGLLADPSYWRRHAREPVQFTRSIQGLADRGCNLFVEIGPHPTLLGMARRCLTTHEGQWLPSLRKNTDDWQTILDTLATLFVQGVNIDWKAFDSGCTRRRVGLPTYPFERQSYWVGEPGHITPGMMNGVWLQQGPQTATGPLLHPLLGRRIAAPIAERIFENTISSTQPEVLGAHRVHSTVVVPCADFVETALAAATHYAKAPSFVEDFSILEPLVLPGKGSRNLQTIIVPLADNRASFQIVTENEAEEGAPESWTTHATGFLRAVPMPANERTGRLFDPTDALDRIDGKPIGDDWRNRAIEAADLTLGASFRWIETHWTGNGEALARMRAPRTDEQADQYQLHPGLIECCFQLLETSSPGSTAAMGAHVLASVGAIRVHGRPAGATWAHAVAKNSADGAIVGDVNLYDEIGHLLLEMKDVRLRRIGRDWLVRLAAGSPPDWVYELAWPEAALPPADARASARPGVAGLSSPIAAASAPSWPAASKRLALAAPSSSRSKATCGRP